MQHLSALDALFLHLETPETPMHVGSVLLLEPHSKARGKSLYANIRKHLEGRLDLAPIFTRRLQFMPLDLANPIWLPVEELDLDWHIQRVTLPRPGSRTQLEACVAKLHEGLLDRERPLWQFTVIEGLSSGETALYVKVHHAGLDGQGGVALAQAILDLEPKAPRKAGAAAHSGKGDAAPESAAQMLGAALSHTVSQVSRIVKAVPEAVKAATQATAAMAMSRNLSQEIGLKAGVAPNMDPKSLVPKGLALGPRTPLNTAIGSKRAFASIGIPLEEAKQIARHFEVKLNDVVLALVSGALRRAYAGKTSLLKKSMIGAVPASLRATGDTTQNNQVTMMLVGLASQEKDAKKRLLAIHGAATRAKLMTGSVKGIIPTDLPSLGVPWLMSALTSLYNTSLVANRIPVVANLVISNVPGPPVPLYLAQCRISEYFPVSIVTHGLALNITILSYNGMLEFGLVSDPACSGPLKRWATCIKEAHAELLALCVPESQSVRPARTGGRKVPAAKRAVKTATGQQRKTKTATPAKAGQTRSRNSRKKTT